MQTDDFCDECRSYQSAVARIAELETALRNIRAFLVKVNEGMEMGGIDSQIVADIDLALMER